MIRRFLSRLVYGRYGMDHLGTFTLILSLVLFIVSMFVKVNAVYLVLEFVAYFLMFETLFRMMSRNIARRRAENDRFVSLIWPLKHRLRGWVERLRSSRDYRFFKCPGCGNLLRVPRKKGRIKITCPHCGQRFEKRT